VKRAIAQLTYALGITYVELYSIKPTRLRSRRVSDSGPVHGCTIHKSSEALEYAPHHMFGFNS
jgi:hypothetical protein